MTTFTITGLILAAALYGITLGYILGCSRGYVRGYRDAARKARLNFKETFEPLRLWNPEDLAPPLRGTAGRRVQ